MNAILTFLHHLTVTQVLLYITGACATLSTVNKFVIEPAFPQAGKVIGALCAVLPGDLRTIINDVQKLITDVTSSTGGGGATPPTDNSNDKTLPRMKPPTSQRQRIVFASILTLGMASITFGGFAATTSGCNNFQPPPNTPADVEGAINCVATALLSNGDLTQCLVTYGPVLIADAIQTLLHSQFAKDHPELVPLMKDRLFTVRRQLDAGAVQ